jgi:hydrogenase maturation protease
LKETLIIGLGNILLTDEGVGIHVLKALKKRNYFPHTKYLDLGTSSMEIANFINSRVNKMIIIDCMNSTNFKPGQVAKLAMDDVLPGTEIKWSLHQMKLFDTLKLISIHHDLPEILVIGIVPFEMNNYSTRLSANLEKQFDHIVGTVIKSIAEFITRT